MTNPPKIRPAQVAGSFYDGDPERLRAQLSALLDGAPAYDGGGAVVAAAAPHAGYVYSGAIAAATHKALAKADFDTVVVIGHDFGRHAPGILAVLPESTVFRTPLGDVPVDTELCEALCAAEPRIIRNEYVHREEHTVEVQLPFLQMGGRAFRLVPLLFGEVTPANCRRLAALLHEHEGGRRILVLSSTDLSHYPTAAVSRDLDRKTVAFAEKLDLDGLCQWQNGGDWEGRPGVVTPICSAGGLGTAIAWARLHGATKCAVLRRGNSGDVAGDESRVVGYASLLFVRETEEEGALPAPLQQALLALARQAIADQLAGRKTVPALPDAPELRQPAAVFVTLTQNGRLRGCIGTTAAHLPLAEAVVEYAQAAAFQDPRFPAVTAEELPRLHIEISVLSPMRRIQDAGAIRPGVHGVTVRRGRRSGLFLPQVWEQLPDLESFLGYLCAEKAGLPYDAWKDPATELQVFTVHAFEEPSHG